MPGIGTSMATVEVGTAEKLALSIACFFMDDLGQKKSDVHLLAPNDSSHLF